MLWNKDIKFQHKTDEYRIKFHLFKKVPNYKNVIFVQIK